MLTYLKFVASFEQCSYICLNNILISPFLINTFFIKIQIHLGKKQFFFTNHQYKLLFEATNSVRPSTFCLHLIQFDQHLIRPILSDIITTKFLVTN